VVGGSVGAECACRRRSIYGGVASWVRACTAWFARGAGDFRDWAWGCGLVTADRSPGLVPKRGSDWQTVRQLLDIGLRACACCDFVSLGARASLSAPGKYKLFIDGADQERKLLLNLGENPDSCKK
jgi:hypothetical protein